MTPDNTFHPTLWRTCRVLANPKRLACLRAVMGTPNLCVAEIAREAGLDEVQGSMALRALQARGLIAAVRESRWVRYVPETDPLVPSAKPLMDVLSRVLRPGEMCDEEVIRTVTAFTHPRRLAMLRCLQLHAPLSIEALSAACGISLPAAYRHLRKLSSRRVVAVQDDIITLVPRQNPLARMLLGLNARNE